MSKATPSPAARVPARQLVAIIIALITVTIVGLGAWTLSKGRASREAGVVDPATEEGWSAASPAPARVRPVADPNSVSSVGWLDCALVTPPGDGGTQASISFNLWVPDLGEQGVAGVGNGEEIIDVDHEWEDEKTLLVRFPHYDALLTLRRSAPTAYEGEWSKRTPSGTSVPMAAYATTLGVARRGDPAWGERTTPVSPSPAAGDWKIEFEKSGPAKGVFRDAPREVLTEGLTGPVLTPTGDYRYLGGVARRMGAGSGEVYLAVFDGAHAFSLKGVVEGDRMTGVFHSGASWSEKFTGERIEAGEAYELPDPFSEVTLRPGETTLRIPQLEYEDYAGKPVIVSLFGTWCPNCHDEAPVLRGLFERHEPEGLRILSLAYEHTDDPERAVRQISRFVERHGVTWDVVFAGLSDKQKAAATLPALSAVKAFPTTIFLNRDHTVRAIHTGFAGPATGEEHTALKAEFDRLTREIVASKAP